MDNNGKLDFLQPSGRVSIVLLYDLLLFYTERELQNTMQCEANCIMFRTFPSKPAQSCIKFSPAGHGLCCVGGGGGGWDQIH